ncbi:hypothetical protein L596_020093 [Steinernema carpocapsae]|nr:hypothetical protein L596_020093 [Steinernema carpocapsae]
MDWSSLVQKHLLDTGDVTKGAIYVEDGAVLTKSDNFNITEEEAAAALEGFENGEALLANGLEIEGEQYHIVGVNEVRIIGTKGTNGFFIYRTPKTIVIAVYEDGVKPGVCSSAAGALVDHLEDLQY